MLRSCLFLLIAYGLLWAGYSWWLGAMFDPPWLYLGSGVAALLVGGCFGALYNARVAYREWSLVAAARHGLPWSDGRWTAVVGEIHPVAEPVKAPFSGEACALCEYDVASASASSSDNGNPGSDFTGFLMNGCLIRSQMGEMRLLGFPSLVGFGERVCDSASAMANARQFLATTPLEDISGLKLVTIFSAIKAVWTDDDGLVSKNLKLTKKSPEELFSSSGEPSAEGNSVNDEIGEQDDADDEGFDDEEFDSDLEDESDEDLDLEGEDDDEDLRTGIPLLKERRVKVGESVCAIGVYSGERRGLIPGGLGADHFIKLIRGKPEKIEGQSRTSVLAHVFGGIVGLVVLHLIAIGVMAATKYDPKQQRQRQEEAFDIVRSDSPNLSRLEKLLGRGVDINSVDGQRRTLLGAAKQPAVIQWLKERGADDKPVLEQQETMSTLAAARLQMTVSLAFHMVFAAIGIGLPLLIVIVEGLYLRTGQRHYLALAKRWAKVMGLLFAVGAVSGTVLSLELGLLWPKYMELMGPVVGHIFGLEGYAFFLEAIFIGLYLYGWDRLRPVAHWWCGVVIAVSGMLSGVFVLGVNAWMQAPVGFEMVDGRVVVTDPIAIFKHPLWAHMAIHSTLACYNAVAFAFAGWYAWRVLRGRADAYARSAIFVSMLLGSVCAVAQPLSGDFLAKYVFRTQPVKFAAMEGQFQTQRHAPLRIGGWPDDEAGETRFAIEIPGGLSYLATGDPAAEVPGLDRVARSDWPNVELTHASFQIMVGSGMALLVVSALFWFCALRYSAVLPQRRWLMWAMVLAAPLGFVGLEAGWFVTEVGRQPWIIQGVMRTADSVTPAAGVSPMFFVFSGIYVLLGVTVVVLLRRIAASPGEDESHDG